MPNSADQSTMTQSPPRNEPADSEHRALPMVVPEPGEQAHGWLARVMRILFGWKAASTRADLELVLTAEQPQSGFSPAEAAMLKNILGLRETPDRKRHGAARRHRRGAAGHHARRTGQGVRGARRIPGSSSTTTRSTTRPAWSTSAILWPSWRRAPPSIAGRKRRKSKPNSPHGQSELREDRSCRCR